MGLPDLSVVLAQVHDEAQQGTFRLVADLGRQLIRIFWELEEEEEKNLTSKNQSCQRPVAGRLS